MTARGRGTGALAAPGGTAGLAGHTVARVGFGAMQLGLSHAEHGQAVAILRQAVTEGVNHIDTAQFYTGSNGFIRDALTPYPDDLVLVTKVGAGRDGAGDIVPAQRPEQLRGQVEANLTSLGTDHVAVANLRRMDAPPGHVADGDQQVPLDDQLAEMIALRDAGKIGAIGLSAVSAERVRQALPAGVACVQNAYSVLDRSAEPALDICRENDIGWVPFFPLGSAFPGMPKVTGNPVVTGIAAGLEITAAQVGLAWLLAHDDGTLLIPGTSSPAHLRENIAAGSVQLPPEAVTALDQLAPPV